MKFFLSALIVSTIVLTSTRTNARPVYYGANLGGSTYLSWMFLDQVNGQGHYGYACVTRDALGGMARTANFDRYAILPPIHSGGSPVLSPLNAVVIYPNGSQIVVNEEPPMPPSELFNYAPMDETGAWFASDPDFGVNEMERACLDGGITGAVQLLETRHGIDVPGF